ncbi:unnamed protein product [Cyprideis torosa]|uniref:Uncharacterized protein n=1 Tax=Cyprideis torosa TaxID=163714 RepID=A0A7R8WA08_9CRUS|nr:unnamed protein product [Cyprideis torosa]CAG0890438.1 unnamed protein product [Cyprideis torosa]
MSTILFLYMLFLLCLDPLIISSKRGQDTQALTATDYQEQQNEDDESYGSVQLRLRAASSSGGNVLDRVGQQQDKWKRQVQEQRRNIYDKHNLLN